MWILTYIIILAAIFGNAQLSPDAKQATRSHVFVMAVLNSFNNNFIKIGANQEVKKVFGRLALEHSLLSNKYFYDDLLPEKLIIHPDDLRKHYLYFSSTKLIKPTMQQVYANAYVKHLMFTNMISFKLCTIFYARLIKKPKLDHSYRCARLEFYLQSLFSLLRAQVFEDFARLTEIENETLPFYFFPKRPTNPDTKMCAYYVRSLVNMLDQKSLRINSDTISLPTLFKQRPVTHMNFKPAVFQAPNIDVLVMHRILDSLRISEKVYKAKIDTGKRSFYIGESSSAQSADDDLINDEETKQIYIKYWKDVFHLYSPQLMDTTNYFDYAVRHEQLKRTDWSNVDEYVPDFEETLAVWETVSDLLEFTKYESKDGGYASGSNAYKILRHIEKTKLLRKIDLDEILRIGETSDFFLKYSTSTEFVTDYTVTLRDHINIRMR